MRSGLLAAACIATILIFLAGAHKVRRHFAHSRAAAEILQTVQAAPMPAPDAAPEKTAFRLRCSTTELPSLSAGAAIHPELAPAGLTGKVMVRGGGAIRLSKPEDGCSFGKGGQQARDTAYLQFTGPGVGALFDASSPGAVSFTLRSSISFAERAAFDPKAGHPFRAVFDVYEEASNQMNLNLTVQDGFLAIVYSVGTGPGAYYFFPKGQEDEWLGKGVTLKVKLAWDGRGTRQLFLNGKLVDSKPYGRTRPDWSQKASFAIGARDQHEYGGGFFACPDTISDFTVASSGPFRDTTPPQVSLRFPAPGEKISGAVVLEADANDDDSVSGVRFLVDGAPVANVLSYPYRAFWDTRSVSPGAHTITAEAVDPAGNVGKKEAAVAVEAPPAADREPPAPVASLETAELHPSAIAIAWMPAADNVGVTEYRVYRDQAPVGSVRVQGVQKKQRVLYTDSAVQAGRTYAYQVEAVDAAGNAAPLSAPLSLAAPAAEGTVRRVGPGQAYAAPCAAILAAHPGDTIEIDAAGNGTYDGDVCGWNTDDLTIRGVNGRARIDSRGRNAELKGVWVIKGRHTTVENVEISGATAPDRNGAAIRNEGPDTVLRHVYFHHNQDGILSTVKGGALLIEFSEFAYNGDGSGQTHNLYINEVDRLTFRYNYSHHAKIGHLLKSRARENYILYNRLTDETGTSSYEMDFPNGGLAYVIGNIVQQSVKTDNDIFISCGLEGLRANTRNALYFINNTLVNELPKGRFFNVVPMKVVAVNNILAGANTTFDLPPGSVKTNNLLTDPGFVNPAARDYRLKPGSPAHAAAADAGAPDPGGPSLKPEFHYVHPTGGSQIKPESRRNIGAL